ncbi:MAG: hypothetical protein ACK5YB_06740 [Burkholderiales bacterium]
MSRLATKTAGLRKRVTLMERLQRRTGDAAIGASTARGMGPKGTIQKVRGYFHDFDLNRLTVRSHDAFRFVLDKGTEELVAAMPRGARHWGSARKFLNIFFRDCVYNTYLNQHFGLSRIEPWLEVPLDSHVGKQLRGEQEGGSLPRWKTVIGLQPDQSRAFQEVAQQVAARKGVARVHLDLWYWRSDKTRK